MSNIQVNPFRALRERQGISQYELGKRCSISKHAILRLEQGMYPNPLPAVVNYFLEYYPNLYSSHVQLADEYQAYQIAVRESNARILGDLIPELSNRPVNTHPLVFLREAHGLNTTELAKRLCVAQQSLYYFEKSSINQHSVPEQLIHALHDADYTEEETDRLCEAYDSYRTWLIKSKQVVTRNAQVPILKEPA